MGFNILNASSHRSCPAQLGRKPSHRLLTGPSHHRLTHTLATSTAGAAKPREARPKEQDWPSLEFDIIQSFLFSKII
jgi:hypothetical protein